MILFGICIIGSQVLWGLWARQKFTRTGLRRGLWNKWFRIEMSHALIVLMTITLTYLLTVLVWEQAFDGLPPSLKATSIVIGLSFVFSLDAIVDVRKRNQTNISARLEALSLLNYYSTFLLLLLLPIVIGVLSYSFLHWQLHLTHGVSYFIALFPTIGSYTFISRLYKESKSLVNRGQQKGTHAEANKRIDERRASNDNGLSFGGLTLPSEAATGHFLTVGTTGSGKTVTIKLLMNDALPPIKNKRNHRAIILDAKRELYAYLLKIGFDSYNPKTRTGQIHTLNPFDARCAAWDIAKDIDTKARARELANFLIPSPEKEGDNAYFSKAARRVLSGVIYSFIITSDEREAEGEDPIPWTLRDVIIALQDIETIRHILDTHSETRYIIKKYLDSERGTKDVLSTLDASLSDFEEVAALYEHAPYKISLREWVENRQGSILLLGWDKENDKAIEPLNRIIFQYLSNLLLNQENSSERRTWVFLDELRVISKGLPGLHQLLNMGREKGACCVLGVIDISGLMGALGDKMAEEVTGLCDNVAGLRTRSAPTAKWLSDLFGNAELQEQNISRDTRGRESIQEHTAERKVFLSGEFQELERPTKENGFTFGGFYLNAYTKPYRHDMQGVGGWMNKVPSLSNEEINDHGVIPHSGVKAKQRLKAWDEDDLERLGLSIELEKSLKQEQEQQSERKSESKSKVNWSAFRMVNDADKEEEIESDQEIENRYEQ